MHHQIRHPLSSFPRRSRISSAVLLAAATLAACSLAGDDAQQPAAGWHTDFAQAEAEARRLNKPLLVHFGADWCLPCKRMERDALVDPVLVRNLGRHIVGVKIDIDRQKELARRFEIQSVPGDVVLSPDGTVLAQSSGYQPPQKYLQLLATAHNRFVERLQTGGEIAAAPDGDGDGGDVRRDERRPILARPTSQARTRPQSPPHTTVAAPVPPLGMDGYNPIVLYNHRQWQRGDEKLAALYKGIEYRFNSVRQQQEFLTTPQHYAPRLLGCDPVVLHESDRALPGSTQHAAYYDGGLYLFVSNETRERFRQHPDRYTQAEHVLLLDVAP